MVPGVSGSVGEHAHEITGLVRVHSIDLKTFDLAGGVQGSQKARFSLAYHGHLYQALIPLLTRQDPNLSNPNRHFSNLQFQNVYD